MSDHLCQLINFSNDQQILSGKSQQIDCSFRCGGCLGFFGTICLLHSHCKTHSEGGSYYFDHVTNTAYPRYDTACSYAQVDLYNEPENNQDFQNIINSKSRSINDSLQTVTKLRNEEIQNKSETIIALDVGASKIDLDVNTSQRDLDINASKRDFDVDASKRHLDVIDSKRDFDVNISKRDFDVDASKRDVDVIDSKRDLDVNASKRDLGVNASKRDLDVIASKKDFYVNVSGEDILTRVTVKNIQRVAEGLITFEMNEKYSHMLGATANVILERLQQLDYNNWDELVKEFQVMVPSFAECAGAQTKMLDSPNQDSIHRVDSDSWQESVNVLGTEAVDGNHGNHGDSVVDGTDDCEPMVTGVVSYIIDMPCTDPNNPQVVSHTGNTGDSQTGFKNPEVTIPAWNTNDHSTTHIKEPIPVEEETDTLLMDCIDSNIQVCTQRQLDIGPTSKRHLERRFDVGTTSSRHCVLSGTMELQSEEIQTGLIMSSTNGRPVRNRKPNSRLSADEWETPKTKKRRVKTKIVRNVKHENHNCKSEETIHKLDDSNTLIQASDQRHELPVVKTEKASSDDISASKVLLSLSKGGSEKTDISCSTKYNHDISVGLIESDNNNTVDSIESDNGKTVDSIESDNGKTVGSIESDNGNTVGSMKDDFGNTVGSIESDNANSVGSIKSDNGYTVGSFESDKGITVGCIMSDSGYNTVDFNKSDNSNNTVGFIKSDNGNTLGSLKCNHDNTEGQKSISCCKHNQNIESESDSSTFIDDTIDSKLGIKVERGCQHDDNETHTENIKQVQAKRKPGKHGRKRKDYVCKVCGKVGSRGMIEYHKEAHAKDIPYKCEVCEKRFKTRSCYMAHLRIHGERNYKCDQCPAAFFRKQYLDTHKRKHTGEVPYMCDLCGTGFMEYYILQRHINSKHKQVRKYACDVCGLCFFRGDTRNQHRDRHYAPTLKCAYCSSMFKTELDRRKHELSHTGEKQYLCPNCKTGFTQGWSYYRHMWKQHEIRKDEAKKMRIRNPDLVFLRNKNVDYLHVDEPVTGPREPVYTVGKVKKPKTKIYTQKEKNDNNKLDGLAYEGEGSYELVDSHPLGSVEYTGQSDMYEDTTHHSSVFVDSGDITDAVVLQDGQGLDGRNTLLLEDGNTTMEAGSSISIFLDGTQAGASRSMVVLSDYSQSEIDEYAKQYSAVDL